MRSKKQCNFFSHDNMTVVYKMFTTLTLICGTTKDENELAIQELLNVFMDCIATYFQHVPKPRVGWRGMKLAGFEPRTIETTAQNAISEFQHNRYQYTIIMFHNESPMYIHGDSDQIKKPVELMVG
ncbi:uncharacterized protein LOC106062137 isoform X5 [Biomphalaria glabrata]|nr:uncharacterized protein LOC106062137 isoform X5 [Biomphalaria glabrata]XP_055880921.1 uncharacterized protein LOC106062137 isoform X5 [Biomphalaria glabrata]XP_055880922.1 uncharacterized protein LOC106062137 isoform X5 [Biomphalaria glabrata]XP_055880923.1 uncharacterized protein LOC106062137 isoform X5 [Biomphalaria glabrata]